ncbi:MAG: hypothetical protein RL199_2035 [Pseudomonadota bacterium]
MKPVLRCLLFAALGACGTPAGDEADVLDVEAGIEETGKADAAAGQTELKVSIRPDQLKAAVRTLGLTDAKAEARSIYFYDTKDLSLFERGLILRARKVKHGADDSTVKMRPLVSSKVDKEWFGLRGFKCEEDRTGKRSVESCSLTEEQDPGEIDDVASGDRSVDKLFSRDQEAFASAYGPPGPPWDDLIPLGPIAAKAWKLTVKGFETKLSAERWTLPDGIDLLEVSIKVAREDADRMQSALTHFLKKKGLDASTTQETKTRVALENLSAFGQ